MSIVVISEATCALGCTRILLTAVEQMHDGADHESEHNGAHRTGNAKLSTQYLGGDHNGHDIDRRPRIEKSDCCTQAGTTLVDAAKQR